MLNMKTQVNQSIFIGSSHTLRLESFDENFMRVKVSRDGDRFDVYETYTISASGSETVCPEVELHYLGIGSSGYQYAILGFDAPGSINIKGEWQNFNRDPGPLTRAKLSQMSDATLVYYASINAKSALEHELFNRFRKRIQ